MLWMYLLPFPITNDFLSVHKMFDLNLIRF